MFSDLKTEVAAGIAKVTPPVTVGASILAGIQLSDVILILTGVYTCIQCYISLYNFIKSNKNKE